MTTRASSAFNPHVAVIESSKLRPSLTFLHAFIPRLLLLRFASPAPLDLNRAQRHIKAEAYSIQLVTLYLPLYGSALLRMNLPTSSQPKKTSHSRGKTTGWAAFDQKHRQGHALESETEHDPFPPISRAIVSPNPCQILAGNNSSYKKPFLAVLQSSVDFPRLAHNKNEEKQLLSDDSSNVQGTSKDLVQESHTAELKKLMELHSWAANELIVDIVEALDNDFVKASTLLEGMLSAGLFEGDKECKREKQNTSSQDSSHDELTRIKDFSSGKNVDFSDGTVTLNNDSNSVNKYMIDEKSLRGKTYDDSIGTRSILDHLKSLPLEPEWEEEEEEDVYLRFRKDAIRVLS